MVFYRKYRPQTLSEIIGQDAVMSTLTKAFQTGNLAHAYLFTGPRGTGKTSTARILAKMVNCQEKDKDAPCNHCESCNSITNGSSLDYIEIDAASNRGIDDIRVLRENIKLAPSNSKKKVYVIDEVHMLTTEAFNALLKTLEEPPEHVLFILATTEVHKVPMTIVSRVQRLDFQLAKLPDLVKALQNVAERESIEFESDALMLIAKRADGSFRDGVKHLDQMASSNQKITRELIEESFKAGSSEDVQVLISAIAKKDLSAGLQLIQAQVNQGVNLKEFIHELLEQLRIMVFQSDKALMDLSEVINLINGLHRALEQMKVTSIPALPLEVVVAEASVGQVSKSAVVNVSVSQPVSVEKLDSQTTEIPVLSAKTQEKLEENKIEAEIPVVSTQADGEDLVKLLDKWTYILETVKPYNYSLEALLRQVKVASCDNGLVILEVPYTFHQRILEQPKSRDLLESVISDVLGKPGRVSCKLGQRPVRVEEIANVELAADDDVLRIAAEIFNS